MPSRPDSRRPDELRPVNFALDFVQYAEGSVLVQQGNTRVLCNATLEEAVPSWLKGQGRGWLTAEYSLLPRSTHRRTPREINGPRGRSQEIQRLIGRALRMAVDLNKLGERQLMVDCDVIQADGGTRTASITGGYLAVALAVDRLIRAGAVPRAALRQQIAAISVGIVHGQHRLDLNYDEDSQAEVDLNVVMTGAGDLIEVQGTAENRPFSRHDLDKLLDLAESGIQTLLARQAQILSAHRAAVAAEQASATQAKA